MDDLGLLIDLHLRNDRQGPGADEQTLRAIGLAGLGTHPGTRSDARPDAPPRAGAPIRIADLGCGTGASALVLARALGAHVTAVDAAPAFVERLRERARDAGLGDRIDARVGDMASPGLGEGTLDAVWSEGAIYNIGFEAGVRAWRRLLRPGGVLAVTELSWTGTSRPAEVEAHWAREYPGIDTVSAKLRVIEDAGLVPIACFLLPPSCWREHYYLPIQEGLPAFLARHPGSGAAERVARAEEAERRLYDEHGSWYGYVFYIARER